MISKIRSAILMIWDRAQAESVSLAQHQLEMTGHRKRGRGKKGKVHKQIAKHFSFHTRLKGEGKSNRTKIP